MLAQALFVPRPALPKSATILSGHATGSAFVVSDYTFLYRATQDLAVEVWKSNPLLPLSYLRGYAGNKDVSLGYHVLGLPSSLGTIIGLVQLKKSCEQTKSAKIIGDRRGVLLGRASQVKDGSVAVASLGMTVFRPAAIANVLSDSAPRSLAARISSASLQTGLVGYAVFFMLLSGILGLQIHEAGSFLQQLKARGSVQQQVAWLRSQCHPDPNKMFRDLADKHGDEQACLMLTHEAIETAKGRLGSLLQELGMGGVSDERLTEIVNGVARQMAPAQLVSLGLQVTVEKARLRQMAKMERILGKAGLDALGKLQGRVCGLSSEAPLIQAMCDSAKGKITENVLMLAVCVLGVVSIIFSIVFTAGMPLLISSVVMFVFSVLTLAADMYGLVQSYREERPGMQDWNMMIFSTMLAVASLLILIALGASGLVTMGLFPMVVAGVFSALWIGQNAATLWVMNRNEKRYQLKHPTLETFIQALDCGQDEERIQIMRGHLPQEIQRRIWWQRFFGRDMKQAALFIAQQFERGKAQRREDLRRSLQPLLSPPLSPAKVTLLQWP